MSVTAVPIQPIKKGSLTKLWVALGAAILLAVALAWFGSDDAVRNGATNEQFLAMNAGDSGVQVTASGLQYKVIEPGEGPSPQSGDFVRVKYTGQLRDGTVFDSSEGQPEDAVAFPVDGVVPGFSEALKLMRVGSEFRIWLPPELAYGEVSPGPEIPAGSLLIFDVTLLDFRSQAEIEAMRQQMEAMQAEGAAAGVPGPQ